MTTALELSWNPEQNRHLTFEDIKRLFSSQHIAWLESQPNPVATAQGRAAGAWQANERESFAAYTRFAELHEETKSKALMADMQVAASASKVGQHLTAKQMALKPHNLSTDGMTASCTDGSTSGPAGRPEAPPCPARTRSLSSRAPSRAEPSHKYKHLHLRESQEREKRELINALSDEQRAYLRANLQAMIDAGLKF